MGHGKSFALSRYLLQSVRFGEVLLQKFLKNSSSTKIFVRLRAASALENVCSRYIALYLMGGIFLVWEMSNILVACGVSSSSWVFHNDFKKETGKFKSGSNKARLKQGVSLGRGKIKGIMILGDNPARL